MSKFTVEVTGIPELRTRLSNVLDPIKDLLEDLAKFGQDRMKLYARPHPADKGTLSEAVAYTLAPGTRPLSAKVSLLGRGHGARSSLAGLAPTVNYGRAPGKPPPVLSILRWLRSHGIHANPRLVAMQIMARGTKGVGFLERAYEDLRREAPAIIERTARRIKGDWGR
ncbi:MAG: hypothetical protein HW375_43 [Anaerolineales bacterium]|nr:hypothetical protein [Anaerolineales bacterium]